MIKARSEQVVEPPSYRRVCEWGNADLCKVHLPCYTI